MNVKGVGGLNKSANTLFYKINKKFVIIHKKHWTNLLFCSIMWNINSAKDYKY